MGKDYVLFFFFFDGGNVFYFGWLFVCVNVCIEEDNKWYLIFNVFSDEYILLNGKVMKSSVLWIDNNDGRVVYVGK